MSLVARIAGGADRGAWDAFIAGRPEADVLQAWAWGAAGADEPGERWERLLVERSDGSLAAVAQVLARSSSFRRRILYVPHGPVWDREAPDAAIVLERIMAAVRAHARRERGVVVKLDPRARPDVAGDADLAARLAALGLRRARHDLQAPTTRILDLAGPPEAILARWGRDARAETRRAGREGVATRIDRAGDARALDAFHALLRETSGRSGFRIRSRAFLGRLAEELVPAGDWTLSLAEADGRAIAGAIAPRTGERAFYLYAASLRDEAASRLRGPYAAMAGLATALAAVDVRTLDLWGVREPDDPGSDPSWEGFSLFKRRFGGTPLRHPGTFDLVIDPFWDRLRDWRERARDRMASR